MKTKFVLRKNPTKIDAPCSIALRITKHRKSTYIYLDSKKEAEFWKSENGVADSRHPNSLEINNEIISLKREAEYAIEFLKRNSDFFTTEELKNQLIRKNRPVSFYETADERLKDLQEYGKDNTYRSDASRIENIKRFHPEELDFRQITASFLDELSKYLFLKQGLAKRSIDNHMMLIRTLYNKAIRDHHIDYKLYPFGRGGYSIKIHRTPKFGLAQEEVKRIENLEIPFDSRLNHVRNAWLFSFYNAGIRVGDLVTMTWQDVGDNKLGYVMGKNKKWAVSQLPPKPSKILEQYAYPNQDPNSYIFPFIEILSRRGNRPLSSKINTITKDMNNRLKIIAQMANIEKKITTHTARHTFGNLAINKIPARSLQRLLRHTDLRTTEIYQANFSNLDVDNDLACVIDF